VGRRFAADEGEIADPALAKEGEGLPGLLPAGDAALFHC
jgi:hypothetical protein